MEATNEVKVQRLHDHKFFFIAVGLSHTLFCAGIIFGWSSLLAIFEAEGVYGGKNEGKFTAVFTYGVIANYLSNLPCGALLDRFGPRTTGIVAAIGLGLGAALCSIATIDSNALIAGFFFIGFFGPCVQLPTLQLSCLFPGYNHLIMMMQAAAFDAGSVVFFIARLEYKYGGVTSGEFFGMYLLVPAYVLLIAYFCWPAETLNNDKEEVDGEGDTEASPLFAGDRDAAAEPVSETTRERLTQWLTPAPNKRNLRGASIEEIFTSREFWFLAAFAGVNIGKLNFIINTIDDQLQDVLPDDASKLSWDFGWMLPLGFLIIPVGSYLLSLRGVAAFQLANILGIVYGFALNSTTPNVQLYVTFPLVALSRQLVYGCVFFTISELYGYSHFGVTLGALNVVVTLFTALMYPVATACETSSSWVIANDVLACATIPLLALAPFAVTFARDRKTRAA